MNLSQGGTSLSSELYSANGVLRGADVMADAGTAFRRGYQKTGGVGNNQLIQLHNPNGSNKIVFVDEITVYLGAVGGIYVFADTVQAANLEGAWYNMKANFPQGSAQVRYDDGLAWTAYKQIVFQTAGNDIITVPLEMPFVLTAGYSLSVLGIPLATALGVNFAGREFAV